MAKKAETKTKTKSTTKTTTSQKTKATKAKPKKTKNTTKAKPKATTKAKPKTAVKPKATKAKPKAKPKTTKAKPKATKAKTTKKQTTILEEMEKLGLDISTSFALLVKAIYKGTNFIGAKYKEKKYLELPNPWGGGGRVKKAYRCELTYGDEKCPMDLIERIQAPFKEMSFLWDWDDFDYHAGEFLNDNEIDNEDLEDFLTTIPDKEDMCLFDGILTIDNCDGINHDHRGSDHCLLVLPYESTTQVKTPTLRDFVDRLYFVKSHKFDNWYEMYYSCSVKSLEYTCELKLQFDHGS